MLALLHLAVIVAIALFVLAFGFFTVIVPVVLALGMRRSVLRRVVVRFTCADAGGTTARERSSRYGRGGGSLNRAEAAMPGTLARGC